MPLPPLVFQVDASLAAFNTKMKAAATTAKGTATTMGTAFATAGTKIKGITTAVRANGLAMATAFGGVATSLGGIATKVGLIGGIIGGAALKFGATWESEMARARTQVDLTDKQWTKFSDNVLALAGDFGQKDFSEIGGAVFDALSTGVLKTPAEALDLLTVAMEANVGTGAKLSTTVLAATKAWAIFGKEGLAAVDTANLIQTAVSQGAGTFEEYATGMQKLGAQSANFNLGPTELLATLSTLSKQMPTVAQAATGFMQVMNSLEKPQAQQVETVSALNEAIKELAGVNESSIAIWGSVEGVVKAAGLSLIDWSKAGVAAAGGIGPFMQNVAGVIPIADAAGVNMRLLTESAEGWNAFLALSSGGGDAFNEALAGMADSAGSLRTAYNITKDTLGQNTLEMIAQAKALGVTLVTNTGFMDDLGVIVANVTEKLKGWIEQVKETIETNPELIEQWKGYVITGAKVVAGLIALAAGVRAVTFVVGLSKNAWILLGKPMVWIASKGIPALISGFIALGKGIVALMVSSGPVGWLILGITAIGTAIFFLVDDWDAAWNSIKSAAAAAALWILDKWDFFVDGITGLGGVIFDALAEPFTRFFSWVREKWDGLWDWFSSFDFSDILPDFLQFGGGGSVPGFNKGGQVQGFHEGGQVRGPAGLDVIPARLTEGEFVINAKSSEVLGKQFLEALNRIGQGGTSQAPLIETLNIGNQGFGGVDETTIREQFLPELERLVENQLSPRGRSIR